MLRFITLTLLMTNSVAMADALHKTAEDLKKPPVIISQEVIKSGVCRLYFDDGSSQDISCKQKKQDRLAST